MVQHRFLTRKAATVVLCIGLLIPAVRARAVAYRTWAALYGGTGAEEMEGIRETADGGYIITGSTDSYGDVVKGDAWIVKLDVSGNIQWQKTYGGLNDESLIDVRQTVDGGYIVAGWTKSFGVVKMDVWVLKLSATGTIEWEKSYGGSGNEQAWSVEVTSDGAYLVAGGTTSFGAGHADYWLLKLDTSGNILWQKTYGGSGNDGGAGSYPEYVVRAIEDVDGNYVMASETYSFGAGISDIWVVKLDSNGNILWQKAYGGADEDSMWSFVETSDGGYLVPGSTVSFSPDYSGDMWVLKLDKAGNILWQKVFGVANDWDEVLSVGATTDGGGLLGGYVEQGTQDWDLLLLRVDANGVLQWKRRYEYGWDWPNAIQQTHDGGFAIAAVGWPNPQDLELWALRIGADGRIGPSCSLVRSLTLRQGTSNATPITTNAVAGVSTASPRTTSAIVQDSPATPNFQCQAQLIEDCANGVDDDGDTLVDCNDPDCQGDVDGDGYVETPCGPDCDDNDAAINPAAVEVCTNGKDDECDGLTDCADSDCQTNIDTDTDGYFALPCGTDCDDADPAVHPGAVELCTNTKDDDCNGSTDCVDTACMPLSVCTLSAPYCKRRSVARFNPNRIGRDGVSMKVGVTQSFCDALSVMLGDPTKSLSATVGTCPDIVVTGDVLLANKARTVYRGRSPRGQFPGYLLKVNCHRMEAIVKLRRADLKTCIVNPVGVTLSADGTRSLYAEGTFTEVRDGSGNLKRMLYLSPTSCAP